MPLSLWNFQAAHTPIIAKQNARNCKTRWTNFLKAFVPGTVLYASMATSINHISNVRESIDSTHTRMKVMENTLKKLSKVIYSMILFTINIV